MPATAAATCELCELPLFPGALSVSEADTSASDGSGGSEYRFCCAGCANVYAILKESGLLQGDFRSSELYQQSLRLGLISANPAASNGATKNSAIPPGTETRDAVFHLSGLWCTACGWLIEHALLKEHGVIAAEVLFTSDLLKVAYCPQYLAGDRIVQRVASLGYRAQPYTGETRASNVERRDLLLRFGVAGALWMNVMLFSLVVYASYFGSVSNWAGRGVPIILAILASPVVFYSGWPILRIAAHGLRHGTVRTETLISSGVLAAYGYSLTQIGRGGHHFYFDTACAIVTLVLTGKVLERGAKEKTARSVTLLHSQMPTKARLWTAPNGAGKRQRFVSIQAVQPGMVLLVKPGERIPADSIILEGRSTADESLITGESAPLEKSPGDPLVGGSVNGSGVLRAKVTRVAADSTLAQIVRAVETAVANRTPLERLADRLSRAFVPAVTLFAVAAFFLAHYDGVSAPDSMLRAIAVLVIACPCALGIATPLAATAAIGAAARAGILVRDATVFESARHIDVLLLDKTGTVTEGNFRLQEAWWTEKWSDQGLALIASVEAYSEHRLGRAIVRLAEERGLPGLPCHGLEITKGGGIAGQIAGHEVKIGSWRFLTPDIPAELAPYLVDWEHAGLTVVFCAIDGELAGALALGDRIRDSARSLVDAMHQRGVEVVLISGDACAATARIAEAIGADKFHGEVRPEGKVEFAASYRARGQRVAMAGDGINDAPALAAADLGIAMGSGTDLAMHSAPLVLMSNSLAKIPAAMDLARRTHRAIRQNLFWAFFYNTAGIAFAALGVLNPLMAAAAMALSSLSVVGNSMRLSRRLPD